MLLLGTLSAKLAESLRGRKRSEGEGRHEPAALSLRGVFDNVGLDVDRCEGRRVAQAPHPTIKSGPEPVVESIGSVEAADSRSELLPRLPNDDRSRRAIVRSIYGNTEPRRSTRMDLAPFQIAVRNGGAIPEDAVDCEADGSRQDSSEWCFRCGPGCEQARRGRRRDMTTVMSRFWIVVLLCAGALHAGNPARTAQAETTTAMARKLVLDRIDEIAAAPQCRHSFGQQQIDLELLRDTVRKTRFYNSLGADGDLTFSQVVGKPASPDERLRALAAEVAADAFVLGYFDGARYVRTRSVILKRGFFEQAPDGISRPTTTAEKQALLLHEILHIALNEDEDDLSHRNLCPMHLLSFCPRSGVGT
jgi:hypothetical protein